MHSMFKDERNREDAPQYKIYKDRPVNINEGLHKVDFNSIDKKIPVPNLKLIERHDVKERHFEVPLCVHN